ncbi:3D domain-containing protein [Ammoniphilus sp. YIM 78166]|uniref:3D domain-containing protein n=1 Tax=Ammoniphilus sp. YIM 78166 TaxID=1644106 RepID=UPI00106F7672|nr:3D domain-containing protein [Ammoniphilus sp. YIM 78166]
MKLVHTTYVITTVIFLFVAVFLLTEQSVPLKEPLGMKQKQVQHKPEVEENRTTSPENLLGQLEKVNVVATGYYAGVESTGKDSSHPQYGITYSGAKVVRGEYSTIAADLNLFPLGTILYIPGYGYGVVADIGSAIKGNIIDLYFDTKEDVFSQWGKKSVDVYVVKRGDGYVNDAMIQELNSKQVVQVNTQVN